MIRNIYVILFVAVFASCLDVANQLGNKKKCDVENKTGSRKLPGALYEEWHKTPKPDKGELVITNPPSLLWPSEKHWNQKDVLYRVYLSQDPVFRQSETFKGEKQRFCFFNPHQPLATGKWYWKYDIIEGDQVSTSGVYSFVVGSEAKEFDTPSFEIFLAQVPKSHPRVMTQGKNVDDIRKDAPKHPLYQGIVSNANQAIKREIYRGEVGDPEDPAKDRKLKRKGGDEVKIFHQLLEGYILTGDQGMLKTLIERIRVFLDWPTDDLLGSNVLVALSMGYDMLFDELDDQLKQDMLQVIEKQIHHGLDKWPGLIESRHVENHFWQMEISGNFAAALATVHDLESSKEMLRYTYELFLARFPNLATQEGGWAEGHGYFKVNKRAIVDMAVLMKKVGGVDVFKMNWYQNLADYFIYFAPVDGRISGFGDMHDRVGVGNVGESMMLVVGCENNDKKALFRLSQLMKAEKGYQDNEQWVENELKNIEPWYQVVNDIHFDPLEYHAPQVEDSKLFKGVGVAALHTDVLNSENNTAVYFRSSPFGAKGHMHANQNCFNISRKGEPIFYSTGYYTSFADPHSLTSYRHTRAHNAILVNGCGQAFGHEGYGWIKRFINGQEMSYVCGDATMAYRPTVDEQFIKLNLRHDILQTPEYGFGDGKLKLFERHVLFIRPNTVVIYDILESEEPADWTFLLHTMKQPHLDDEGQLRVTTDKNEAKSFVTGSLDLTGSITDQFYSPAIDFKKKYKAVPNQFHVRYKTRGKSKNMRFLAIIQLCDKGNEVPEIISTGDNRFSVGDIHLKAELDSDKPASLIVEAGSARFYINELPEVVTESKVLPKSDASYLIEEYHGEVNIKKSENMFPSF